MNKSLKLSVKIGILVGISIIISAIAVEILCLSRFRKEFYSSISENLKTTEVGITDTLGDWSDILEYAVVALAGRPNFIEAIERGDAHEVSVLAEEKKSIVGMDIMVVTDARGRAISGVPQGSDLSGMACVRDIVVDGLDVAHTYESSNVTGYAMLVASSIKNEAGNTIGALVAGYDFTKPNFVEKMKNIYQIELTVFEGNTRVSTTLRDESGRSWTGTKMDNAVVMDTVQNRGQTYSTEINLLGQNYLNIYFPLKTEYGKITGMISTAKSAAAVSDVMRRSIQITAVFLIVLCIVLCTLSGVLIVYLLKPLKEVKDTLHIISSGDADLTRRIDLKANDEIGEVVQGFNAFAEKLQHIVTHMKDSKNILSTTGEDLEMTSSDTAAAITQILANIESIHNQINGQKASVDQTAGAVDEISSNITSLNHMIETQSSGVTEASAAVEEMIGNIRSVSHSMEKMTKSFTELAEHAQNGFVKLETVSERVQQIESQSELLQDANQVIASIAEQTNLLAMNAAIEAAHAGEAGKGFAVVADEIRKLSENSSVQSKTIGDQLNQIQESISNVVAASTESGQIFSLVSQELKATDELVMQIRAAMEEQNEGSNQITEALKLMNDSTVEVREASAEMNEGNKLILSEVQQLQDATIAMKQNMDEMHAGARRINETGVALTDISHKVKHSIDKIGNQIDEFTV